MHVKEALQLRKSVRAFLDQPVKHETIETILAHASHAPSGTNTQPWQVAVVSGESKTQLCRQLESAFRGGEKSRMDYHYYPQQWHPPYKDRRRACGLQMYSTLEITREDKQKQLDQWAQNYQAFGAPVVLFFFLDPVMEKGSYIDYGMFLQSLMLVATEQGLASCPQAALAEYPDIVKRFLGYDDHLVLLCGMAIGYEDSNAPVNSYRTPREAVDKFTQFFD